MSNKQIDKKIAEIKSAYWFGEPVYSKIRCIEEFCLFLSRWKYRLTSGLYYKVKYFFQRRIRGFDDLDRWNAGWYIARCAVAVLKSWRQCPFMGTAMRKHRIDRFGNIVELKHEELIKEDYPDSFTEEEWRAIVDDIIFAFQFIIDEDLFVGNVDSEEYNKNYKRHKDGLKLFSIYLTSLWD